MPKPGGRFADRPYEVLANRGSQYCFRERVLVAEMPPPGDHHRHVSGIGGGNALRIAD